MGELGERDPPVESMSNVVVVAPRVRELERYGIPATERGGEGIGGESDMDELYEL